MKTKICGITTLEDAKLAIESNAWALGFNFYSRSPRYLQPLHASTIIKGLPKKVLTVGLFVDQTYQEVKQIMENLKLDLAQVYQDYACPADAKKSMIFAIQPFSQQDVPPLNILRQYAYILIDAPRGNSNLYGGTGRLAEWDIARTLNKDVKLLLAGGLNISNIKEAIHSVQPYGIDICSSIESSPGIKDPLLLKQFLTLCSYDQ